jgi:hypothetical protein
VNQPLVEGRQNDQAKSFTAMAERIEQNATQPFGGAVVIVPPGTGQAIEMLMLDPNSDLAMFWSTIRTKIDILLASAEAEKRRQAGFGGR